MSIELLAALIAPREIAPHPNTHRDSDVPLNEAETLALHFLPRAWQQRPSVLVRDRTEATTEDVAAQTPFADACKRATASSSYREGTETLARMCRDHSEQGSLATAAPGSLLAAVMFAEMDRHDDAISLLEDIMSSGWWAEMHAPDARILQSFLLSQLAMRRIEAHGDVGECITQAQDRLRAVPLQDVTPFDTSPGVNWNYRGTTRRLVAAQRYVLKGLLTRTEGRFGRRWADMVKIDMPPLLRQCDAIGSGAYARLIQQRFNQVTLSKVSQSDTSEADQSLWQTLMRHELHGDWYHVQNWRLRLGQTRLLALKAPETPTLTAEALQLIRHSLDAGDYIKALRAVKSSGPLAELKAETELVADRRLDSISLRKGELATLQFGGQLLGQQEADRALEAVLKAVIEPVYMSPSGAWEHPGSRLDDILMAALELAHVVDAHDRVADRMLAYVASGEVELESLSCRAYTKAIGNLDWEKVSPAVKHRWVEWVNAQTHAEDAAEEYEFQSLCDAVRERLDTDRIKADGRPRGSIKDLRGLVTRLNIDVVTQGKAPLDREEVEAAASLLVPMLTEIQGSARQGVFQMGGYSPAELAVMVASSESVRSAYTSGPTQLLWATLVGFLGDPLVSREDKTLALSRLRMNVETLPDGAVEALGPALRPILGAPPPPSSSFFGGDSTPEVFPEALRATLALTLLPSSCTAQGRWSGECDVSV